ncbi:unnamed protein product [Mytilus edulis]|uniref:Uncharacterized protein n=1 Tax=Mytilus edulis TaxID=6550 RepID=A0A8S3U0S2_MYTED|nr:unnamed protein product [Mytilus edulis]
MLPLPRTPKQSTENIITNFEFKENTGFLEEPSNYCHLNLSIEDTIKAKEKFEEEMLKDENIFAFYIYLSKPPELTTNKLDEYIGNDEARNKWNGLQEWFWVKQDMKYYTLNLPIDLDALTFRISRYGTQNIDIRWTLGTNCHKNNTISYKNETQIILNYIWTNIIGNKSKSYICHRNFDKDINDLEILWWLTTVWVGYDFDCFKINSLKEGIVESVLISKK